MSRRGAKRWLAPVLAAAAVLGGAALLLGRPQLFGALAFLGARAPGPWIVYPLRPIPEARPALRLEARFRRAFELAAPPARAELRARGFRSLEVRLNGEVVLPSEGAGGTWRETRRREVGRWLRSGANLLEARVANATGPPALALALEGPGLALESDAGFEVSLAGATPRPARLASARPGLALDAWEGAAARVPAALVARAPILAALALLAAGLVGMGHLYARLVPREPRAEPALLGLGAALLWLALQARDARELPVEIGFDVTGHLGYLAHLGEKGSLPLGHEGWQMYQPPLYYLLAAGLLALRGLSAGTPEATLALRGLGAALGAAQGILLYASARLLFPGRRLLPALVLAFAAALPLHTTLFQSVSNETLAMPLVSLTAFLALRALRAGEPAPGSGRGALLGAVAGLAALAKFSAVLVLPPLLLALLARGRREPARAARSGAALLAAFAAVCGWHFARVWQVYGQPFPGNWDPALGFDWWQDPGYRMAGDYLRFGSVLVEPFFAGLRSVPDGLYSTLFGDGLLSGRRELAYAPPWDLPLMAAGYVLALVPAGLAAVGAARLAARLLTRPCASWLLVLGLGATAALALLAMTLRVPSYTLVKAHFGHPGLLALSACLALGFEGALRGPRLLRPLLLTGFGTWALASLAAVWIDPAAPSTLAVRGHHELHARQQGPARAAFEAALAKQADHPGALLGLVALDLEEGRDEEAAALCERALAAHPGHALALARCARLHARRGEAARAEAELRESLALRPENLAARALLAAQLLREGRLAEADAVLREGLAARPHDPQTHLALARLELAMGRAEAAARHLDLVLALEPGRRAAQRLRAALPGAAAPSLH